jgi:putative endopeptidase
MRHLFSALAGACAVLAGSIVNAANAVAAPAVAPLASGIELQNIDTNVRAQDDFYRYVNGKWLASAEIPADRARYGAFDQLRDTSLDQLRAVVESLAQSTSTADADQQKLVDLYATFMDEAAADRLGLKPLRAEFARIDGVHRKSQIPALVAHFNRIGVGAPYEPQVHQDAKDSTRYVFDLNQGGLGLPDRDYYLQNDERLTQIRVQYAKHIETMLQLAGEPTARAHVEAAQIVALETALARVQWTKVENRDPVKAYNRFDVAALPGLAPGYDWNAYLSESGVKGTTDYLVVSQPSYITAFNSLINSVPLPVWKVYFHWHLLSEFAPYLSKPFVDEHFAFYGKMLRGIAQNQPRWKRGVNLLDGALGEGLGRLYVERYFPAQAKARVDELVHNLLAAYRADIGTLTWMGPQTRQKAIDKLTLFETKIGYPVKWRDYSALRIVKGDLVGNVFRADEFEYQRNLNKLGTPVDRNEWEMTPQTVNAYYDPEHNEIVFPAAILQSPFFNAAADDAVNYGAIGAVIGHEISHGFDDQGSQYDGFGNLISPPGWFTQADLDAFKVKTKALVAQYAAYSPVPGYPINGELTLGENIADNSGIAIAYKAYKLSLGGKDAPVIDGLSGEQRFYMGFAQVWRGKVRDNEAIRLIKSDPHSPMEFRGTVPFRNQPGFYEAFGVKEGDKMYLPPDQRVIIW